MLRRNKTSEKEKEPFPITRRAFFMAEGRRQKAEISLKVEVIRNKYGIKY